MDNTCRQYSELSREEKRIIELVREMQYGEVVVSVREGHPISAEVKRSILLKEKRSK